MVPGMILKTSSRRMFFVVGVAVAGSCGRPSAPPHSQTVEFGQIRTADRLSVRTTSDRIVVSITDPGKIQSAADFIGRYRDGWQDVLGGPRAPWLVLDFYRGDRYLGGYGLSTSYLVAGSLSRDTPPEQIAALASGLGLQWPPRE
jgi:hypothetical protein